MVAACLEPDAVLSEIARSADIHVSQPFRWRKALPTASTPTVPTPVSRPRKKCSMVTIELGGGRCIRVESDVDIEALERILDVVERR
ncbi:hypothetical protein ACU8OQ_25735 (plasmid) [Rhizobium leguminosarum]